MNCAAHLGLLAILFVSPADTSQSTTVQSSSDQQWHQWRGPARDGRIEAAAWPEELSEDNLVRKWRIEMGPSYSGPIVTEDRVFVTETKDETYEVVKALNRKTGETIWSTQWEGAMQVPFFARENGDWIRSTPAFDGTHLYVAGMKDVLVCLNAENGDKVWSVDFVEQLKTPVPSFGFVCSPMVIGDHVYVQAGGCFAKLNKHTGEIVWRSLEDAGGMNDSAFSSPFLTELHGQKLILVQTRTSLAAVDPESGSVLWSQEIPAFRGMNIVTPTVYGNTVFTSSYGGKSILLDSAKQGDDWTVSEKWENRQQGYMSSPIIIGDHAYLHLRNRRFTCIDLNNGEATYTTTPFGKYWSMINNGDKILALDQTGELRLIKANPAKFELIGEVQVSDQETWAHLAISGNEIFVRELNGMSVFEWK